MRTKAQEFIGTGGWIWFSGGPESLHGESRLRFEPRWDKVRCIVDRRVTHFFRLTLVPLTTGGACLEYVWTEQRRV